MPNYCENDLYISGPEKDVGALLAFVGADKDSPEFDFNAVIPYPDRFRSMDKAMESVYAHGDQETRRLALDAYKDNYGTQHDGYNSGGYEWCLENWGTKWPAGHVKRRDYEGVCFTFQTAWSPPMPVIVALAKKFSTVTLRPEYFERGMGFCGGFTVFSVEDAAEYEEQPGEPCREWRSEYRGHRGG